MKEIRKKLKLTQLQLSVKIGVSIHSIRAYEQGKRFIDKAIPAVQRNWERVKKEAGRG